MTREAISIPDAAPSAGPFSAAVRWGRFTFVSGQVGADPQTGSMVAGGTREQAEQIFANLGRLLAAGGKSLDDVIHVNVYVLDMGDYATVNEVYARHFSRPYPARTAIAVAALPLGAAVEMDAIVA